MLTRGRDRALVAGLLVLHVAAMVAVIGLLAGWWSSGDGDDRQAVSSDSGVGIDGPTLTPEGALHLVTATPSDGRPALTPPSPTSEPAPQNTPSPAPTAAPTAPDAATDGLADFSGRWRIFDIVTEGSNLGEVYTFDVSLTQDGNRLSGGSSGISMSGTVDGDTATLQYEQAALGYSGTFVWTMIGPGQAAGTFTNSFPNSGTSTLQRLP